MEKIVAIGFFIFFLLIVVLPISFIIKLVLKSKKSSWSGVVIDKKHNTTTDMDDKTIESYYLVVKMDDGSRDRNIGLSPQLWETFEVGDKIRKPAGKLLPEKI
jgi:hypothetical protein